MGWPSSEGYAYFQRLRRPDRSALAGGALRRLRELPEEVLEEAVDGAKRTFGLFADALRAEPAADGGPALKIGCGEDWKNVDGP